MYGWVRVGEDVGWMVVNACIMLAVAPLVEGFIRKLAARIQGRIGPPLVQPYRDLKKLFARRALTAPTTASDVLYRLGPVAVFATVLCACSLVPTVVSRPLALSSFILVFYLLALTRFVSSITALNVPNPFSAISASREHMLSLGVEPAALFAAAIAMLITGSTSIGSEIELLPPALVVHGAAYILALVAFALAMIADLALPPFDVAEAEQEIYEGPLAEYGGPYLALLKLSIACKRVAMMSLFIAIFIPFGIATSISWWIGPSIAIYLAKLFVIATVATLICVASARLRVWDASRYLLLSVAISILAGIIYILRVM